MIRHLVAIALLPFAVTVLIPTWLARRNAITLTLGSTPAEHALQVGGPRWRPWEPGDPQSDR